MSSVVQRAKRNWLLGVLALIGLATSAHATNLVTNGGFEDLQGAYNTGTAFVTLAAPSNVIPGWTVQSGSVDWIGNYWQPSQGTMSLDLAGYYQHGLILSDPFATQVGKTYRVSFDMAGNPDQGYAKSLVSVATADQSLASYIFSFDQSGNTRSNMGWVTKTFDFVAQYDNSQIIFGDFTNLDTNPNEAWGAALDNVSVEILPEPATFALLGAGLAVLLCYRRPARRG